MPPQFCDADPVTQYGNVVALTQEYFEWMNADEAIHQLVLQHASTDQIRAAARRAGMKTLAEDGWRLVQEGLSTPDEVMRVTKDQSMDGKS